MAKPPRRGSSAPGNPHIEKIVSPVITPGVEDFIKAGKALTSGSPGTTLMLTGSGFGNNADAVTVHFGANAAAAFPPPLFDNAYLLATVPLIPAGGVRVRVTVGGASSNEVSFRVAGRDPLPLPPGTLTTRYLSTLDAFAVLVSAEIRIADFGVFATREFQTRLADEILRARIGLLEARQRLDQLSGAGHAAAALLDIRDEQAKAPIVRVAEKVAEQSKSLFDEFVRSAQVFTELHSVMARIRQGGTTTATKTLEIAAETASLNADIASAVESGLGGIAFSAEAGVVLASANVETNPAIPIAAGVYAILKVVATNAKIAALLSRNADELRQEIEEEDFRRRIEAKLDRSESKLDKLESKQDRTESKLDRTEQKLDKNEMKKDKIEVKLDRVEQKLDKNEIKKDRIEAKLDKIEPKLDRVESKLDRQEGKLDKIEGKSDKAEGKLDKLEAKADKGERKLDRLEGKADKAEGKLDKLEGKSDKAEGKLDKLEAKADKGERKLDILEGKADKAEGKLDKLESKADKAETKLDSLEVKGDKAETKLDRLEGKADRAEMKLDKLEGKADKVEIKLDQLSVKGDRNKEFWQFAPSAWTVAQANAVGVRLETPATGSTDVAFSVESIQLLSPGFNVDKLIVDGIATDVSVPTPCSLLVSLGLGLVGASSTVKVAFDAPYSGPVEFNGEKPQGLTLCTFVEGPSASQSSARPCP